MAHPCFAPFWHYRRSLSLDQSRDKVIISKDPLRRSAKGNGESNLARKTTGGKGSSGKSTTHTEPEETSGLPPQDMAEMNPKSGSEQYPEQVEAAKEDASEAVPSSDEVPQEKETTSDADEEKTALSGPDQQDDLDKPHDQAEKTESPSRTSAVTTTDPEEVQTDQSGSLVIRAEVDDKEEILARPDQEPLPSETATEVASQKPDAPEGFETSSRTETSPETSSLADHSEREENASGSAPPPLPPGTSSQSERRGGFFPLIIGGLIAGAIGYGAHYLTQDGDAEEIAALRNEISQIRAGLGAETPAPDLSAIEAELGALREQVAELEAADRPMGDMDPEALLDQLRADITSVEPSDLSPLQDRLDTIEQTLNSQQDAVADTENRLSTLEADLVDLRDLSERRVAEAEAAIDLALARSGLESVRAALQTGAPYADAVARLREAEVAVPDALANPAAGGVATIDVLQEQFPAAARSALRVALQDAPAENVVDRLQNFVRAQIGARSTVPREGDDPDSILSRAAAHIEAENIETALTEIEALPASAQQAMQPWLDQAQARVAAEAALPDLTNAITTE